MEYDYVITDGGSTDQTIDIASELGSRILHRPGHGKGYGIIQAMNYAAEHNYEFLFYLDCDMTTDPKELDKMLPCLIDSTLVIGCRDPEKLGWKSKVANILMTTWVNILYMTRFRDTNSGCRALRVSFYSGRLKETNFGIEHDALCNALNEKQKISEVDVEYADRRADKSKARPRDLLFAMLTVLSFRLRK